MQDNNNSGEKSRILILVMCLLSLLCSPAVAQNGGPKAASKMLYHDGEVMEGGSNVYLIAYGCWGLPACFRGDDTGAVSEEAFSLLANFLASLGGSPYLAINTTYPDITGYAPNGGLTYGGSAVDRYSHGVSLTAADVQNVVLYNLQSGWPPQDSHGMYIVVATPDVHVDGFCTNFDQFHSQFVYYGSWLEYAFVGNPWRCPLSVAPQFVKPDGSLLPTPNDNFAADAMVSSIAHVVSGMITNPGGNAWFDRYGLENSDKCQGTFGETYTTPNGAQANIRRGGRDFLIQQNWVNGKKGYCGLSYP